MYTVTFHPEGKGARVAPGTLLYDAALRAEVEVAVPCGSQGRCGRCLVKVLEGEVVRRDNAHLSPERVQEGWALVCQTRVEGDVLVEVPPQRIREKLVAQARHRKAAPVIVFREALDPLVQKVHLCLRPPTLADNASDWERLRLALEEEGLEAVAIELPLLRVLAGRLRAARWDITATVTKRPPSGYYRLIDLEPGDTTKTLLGAAIDIGTTTVAVNLVDLTTGAVLATAADYNEQLACGEDIISRIVHSQRARGLKQLHELALCTVNRLLNEASQSAGFSSREIDDVVVAGNTTMVHLFLGLDPRYIRPEPYVPTATALFPLRAQEVGLQVNPLARVCLLPSVAAYVGGDITAGVLSSGLYRTDKLSLFLDVGTNGEIVLGNGDWLMTCACSAGPAFEGAGVRCGMRATEGAIEEVTISSRTLEPTIRVIGDVPPAGICGSGMISALAELFITGIIDKAGKIDAPRVRARMQRPERVREGEHGAEYVLAWASETSTGQDIVLTEVDISSLIRTKAAIYAGIMSLVKSVGVQLPDIEQVLIGGAFGQHINVEKAIQIGLLPDLPWDRFQFLGNTSLLGATYVLLSRAAAAAAQIIAGRMTYLELIADAAFMNEFTSALFLPHTDLEAFPSVKELLGQQVAA